jgi:DNA-binding LacI/PurR family transcriptional regulator
VLERLNGKKIPAQRQVFDVELIERDSVKSRGREAGR